MIRVYDPLATTPEAIRNAFATCVRYRWTRCRLEFLNSNCVLPLESINVFQEMPEEIDTLEVYIGHQLEEPNIAPTKIKEYLLTALRAAALTKAINLTFQESLVFRMFDWLSLEDVKEVFKQMPPNIQNISFVPDYDDAFDHFNTNQLAELSAALPYPVTFRGASPSIEKLNYFQTKRIKKLHDYLQAGGPNFNFNGEPAVAILEYAGMLSSEVGCQKLFQQLPLQKMLIESEFSDLVKQLKDKERQYVLYSIHGVFAQAIVTTCNALNEAKKVFLTSNESIENKKRIFKETCTQVIENACNGILGQHRGHKELLNRLFHLICEVFSVNVHGFFYKHFRPQTASEKICRKLGNAIQKIEMPEVEQEKNEEPLSVQP